MSLLKPEYQDDTIQELKKKVQKVLNGEGDLKNVINSTRNLAFLYEIQKSLENAIDRGKELYSEKSEQWANDVDRAMLRYCNERIEQIEEETAKDLFIEIGVPYAPYTDEFYGIGD